MSFTEQDEKWSSDFGDSYTKRNFKYLNELNNLYKNSYGVTRTDLNNEFLGDIFNPDMKILEVGCNVGTQLLLLKNMGFRRLYGIDINQYALRSGRGRDNSLELIEGNVYDIPFKDNSFDMIVLNGMLIHVPPNNVKMAVDEICRVSKSYVYGLEYYAEKYTEVKYHDMDDMLWKANYPEYFKDIFTCVKQRILSYKDDSGNRDVLFLLKKNEVK